MSRNAKGADAELTREAIRLYRRYAVEVVERLGFCPFAEKARTDGKTSEVVVLSAEPRIRDLLAIVDRLAATRSVEVAFLIMPRLICTRLALARFVERLRAAHQASEGGLVLTMEGFHPDAAPDVSSPERLVPFLRRTPDPTIQLTRLDVLTHVRRNSGAGTAFVDLSDLDALMRVLDAKPSRSLAARIAETNHARVEREGPEAVEAIVLDILRDRDETYARLGERGCPAGAHVRDIGGR